MIKRLFKVMVSIATMPLYVLELIYYSARWVIKGKSFPDKPLFLSILFDDQTT